MAVEAVVVVHVVVAGLVNRTPLHHFSSSIVLEAAVVEWVAIGGSQVVLRVAGLPSVQQQHPGKAV
jgi:hypothetical protein